MGKIQEYSPLVQSILDELDVDVVGLWTIPEDLRNLYKLIDLEEIRRATMLIVSEILSQPGVVFGQFEAGFFQPWKLPFSAILGRIDAEWTALEREPGFLEIGWFAKEGTSSYEFE